MKLSGRTLALVELAIFVIALGALVALDARETSRWIALAWLGFMLLASAYLAWKGWRTRKNPFHVHGPGGWGAVLPARVWRWMMGEDDLGRR